MAVKITNGRLRIRNGVAALLSAAAIGGGGEAAAISLVELLDRSVVQRLNDQRAIPVAGVVTGVGAGTAVEARIIKIDGGAQVTAWASVGVTAADGSYSGMHMAPRGKDYTMQVRVTGSQTVVKTGVNRFGVGAVIGFTGQSNCVNYPGSYELYPTGLPGSVIFDSGIYKRIGAIVDSAPANTPVGTGGNVGLNSTTARNLSGDGFTYMANLIGAQFDMPVCIVTTALGGMGIDYWTQGTKNGWVNFVNKLNQMGGDMEALVFIQGESSAHAYTSYAAIAAEWSKLMAQALAQTGRTTDNFKLIMTSLGPGNYSGATEGEFGRYRVWQRDHCMNTAGFIYGGGAHATGVNSADQVHWTGTAPAYLGRTMPRNYMHRAFGVGISCEGPKIVSATRSGLDVTFTVTHAGGTGLIGGDGGAWTAGTGFRFFDAGAAGAQIGHGATAILNATQFRVTLNSLPVGALTADYAITDVPHGVYSGVTLTYVPASVLRDNVALVNSTVGCLLQPCSAITVTGS